MTNKTAIRPSDWAAADDTPTPDLNMVATFYRVPLSDIGEDGNVVALGHVGKYRMLAALRRHARENWGDDLFLTHSLGAQAPNLDGALDRISHLWMINTGSTEEFGWCMEQAQPSDPNAFPVTWWAA